MLCKDGGAVLWYNFIDDDQTWADLSGSCSTLELLLAGIQQDSLEAHAPGLTFCRWELRQLLQDTPTRLSPLWLTARRFKSLGQGKNLSFLRWEVQHLLQRTGETQPGVND